MQSQNDLIRRVQGRLSQPDSHYVLCKLERCLITAEVINDGLCHGEVEFARELMQEVDIMQRHCDAILLDDEDWRQKYMEFAIEQSIVSEDALVQRVRDRLPGFEQSIFSKLKDKLITPQVICDFIFEGEVEMFAKDLMDEADLSELECDAIILGDNEWQRKHAGVHQQRGISHLSDDELMQRIRYRLPEVAKIVISKLEDHFITADAIRHGMQYDAIGFAEDLIDEVQISRVEGDAILLDDTAWLRKYPKVKPQEVQQDDHPLNSEKISAVMLQLDGKSGADLCVDAINAVKEPDGMGLFQSGQLALKQQSLRDIEIIWRKLERLEALYGEKSISKEADPEKGAFSVTILDLKATTLQLQSENEAQAKMMKGLESKCTELKEELVDMKARMVDMNVIIHTLKDKLMSSHEASSATREPKQQHAQDVIVTKSVTASHEGPIAQESDSKQTSKAVNFATDESDEHTAAMKAKEAAGTILEVLPVEVCAVDIQGWAESQDYTGSSQVSSLGDLKKQRVAQADLYDQSVAPDAHQGKSLRSNELIGFKWVEIGSEKPSAGTEIINEGLAKALRLKREFCKDEMDNFAVCQHISSQCYIRVGEKFFSPAAIWVPSTTETSQSALKGEGSELGIDLPAFQASGEPCPLWVQKLFGSGELKLLSKNNPVSINSALHGKHIIGIFFGASWCTPCHNFVPNLVKAYQSIVETKSFEVVFVQKDNPFVTIQSYEQEFASFFEQMPWIALPYSERSLQRDLSDHFNVTRLPFLILLDGATGEVITRDGTTFVSSDPLGINFPWPSECSDDHHSASKAESAAKMVRSKSRAQSFRWGCKDEQCDVFDGKTKICSALGKDEAPRVVFVGCTGAGKSSLCTVLTGQERANSCFKVGHGMRSETKECTNKEFHWLGEETEGKFLCIDTPGLNDSEGEDDDHIASIISKMKDLEYINAIVLVVNSQDPRFSQSLQNAILKFEKAFCGNKTGGGFESFYGNMLVCFQRWQMNSSAVQLREEEGCTEDSVAQDFRQEFDAKFEGSKEARRALPCIFVDSHDRDQARREEIRQSLLKIKEAIPEHQFRTGDLEQIVPRLTGYDGLGQKIECGREIGPLRPRLSDDAVKVIMWHISTCSPLPDGLTFDTCSGVIYGMPKSWCAPRSYRIQAESVGGRSTAWEISLEVHLNNDDIESLVKDYRSKAEKIMLVVANEKEPKNESELSSVREAIEALCTDFVKKSSEELDNLLNGMSERQKIIDRVKLAGMESKTMIEAQILKTCRFVNCEQDDRLELERASHEVEKHMLVTKYSSVSDFLLLFQLVNRLYNLCTDLKVPNESSIGQTLCKGQNKLEEISPINCKYSCCPVIGSKDIMAKHETCCPFAMKLIPKSAVKKTVPENATTEDGLELVATMPELKQFEGCFEKGPCEYFKDDKAEWFHRLDESYGRVLRIKTDDKGRWVLASVDGPDNEGEILKRGTASDKVDDANFEGFEITPVGRLSLNENYEPAQLTPKCVKILYFGGMWCPHCPPFTIKLKIFHEIVQEQFGENALQIIYVSSDRTCRDFVQYFGGKQGNWLALPYNDREKERNLNKKHKIEGIPSLRVIDNRGDGIEYGFDVTSAIRKLCDKDSVETQEAAIKLFNKLKKELLDDESSDSILEQDYDKVIEALSDASEYGRGHSNVVGRIKDLTAGKFEDAAQGLRHFLKVGDDWREDDNCTIQGIEQEINLLRNCSDCAEHQAKVLQNLGKVQEAEDTRRLAHALASMQEQEGECPVKEIRQEIEKKGNWYYGIESFKGETIAWPEEELNKPYGSDKFRQPLCKKCRRYRLDYTHISENWDYVTRQESSQLSCSNGIRDAGRECMKLEDFMHTSEAQQTKLTKAEVAGLRMYTSHIFDAINEPLRDQQRCIPHPLPALTSCIERALRKMRALNANQKEATEEVILWRGFRDMVLSDEFQNKGGTEPAPMSTTTDPKVAIGYAVRKGQTSHSMLFRIVTANNLQRGADLAWVSMFPGEKEILFPPLTYMQPTSRKQVVMRNGIILTIVEIRATLP